MSSKDDPYGQQAAEKSKKTDMPDSVLRVQQFNDHVEQGKQQGCRQHQQGTGHGRVHLNGTPQDSARSHCGITPDAEPPHPAVVATAARESCGLRPSKAWQADNGLC